MVRAAGVFVGLWCTAALANPPEWFPLQLDLSVGANYGPVRSGSLGVFGGKTFGRAQAGGGAPYASLGLEGTLEWPLGTGSPWVSGGPQARAGWAWGWANSSDGVPRVSLYLRGTPFVTSGPVLVRTDDGLALDRGTYLGARLGLGVTATAWSSACFSAWARQEPADAHATAPPRDFEPPDQRRDNPAYERTSNADSHLLSFLWCFLNHAEAFAEGYGRPELIQYRFGFRVGAGL